MLSKIFWQKIVLWFWIAALVFLFFVNFVQVVHGRVYDYERQTLLARERRLGKETDEFRPVGGKAEITASAIFENGVHLESLEEQAMAVAIYQLEADKSASSLVIHIAYRGSGKIFVVKDKDSGITFELPADQERQTLYLAANYIADDSTVEIHAIADSNQRLDIQFVELESLRYTPEVRVVERYTYLPPEYPRTVYWYYYRGPVYALVRPYEYIVYDSWWDSDWYIGWRTGFRVRTYPVYRYYWRPDRVAHIHHYYDQSKPVIVRELPKSRESVLYTETQRRRPEASRSRLDMSKARKIQKQRVESEPRSTGTSETSRIGVRYRPDSSAQWQTITPSRPSSEVRTKQRREESPAPARTQRESSSRTIIKQRRVESASSTSIKTSDDEEEENRKKRRR